MTKLHNLKQQKNLRRNLRKNQTEAERILWYYLRGKQLKYRFKRQFGIGKYIVDFYCPQLKLIIEIDGATHGTDKEIRYDNERQCYLKNLGFIIKRYRNTDIKKDLDLVIESISEIIEELNSSPSLPSLPVR